MHFDFATATEIVFGRGTAQTVPLRARQFGTSVFLVRGRDGARSRWLTDALDEAAMPWAAWSVAAEPTIDDARAAAGRARDARADVVIGLGGGSAIDLGKAVAALLANPGDPLDYVEVIGRGQPLHAPSVPFIAVPTTAGTGAEVTRNAVLSSVADGVKVSMRSLHMLPRLAVVDPDLTIDLPPAATASTGMDALTQLIEPYVSVRATPISDGFCLEGIPRVARALRRAVADGTNHDARADMALASLLGGLALANAGLGAVHGFAAPLGGRYGAPHGAVCAALLPAVMRVNVDAIGRQGAAGPIAERFATVARLLTANSAATIDEGIAWLDALQRDLAIPRLAHHGVAAADFPGIAAAAARASSMRGNPVVLAGSDLERILTLST
ncbi:MAG: iron-containing alcohol dehydrogenase [Acidobacteria bacterium]|nr:iron-containing alcohol dehydrogenase [Acidobacteriota bacterium]